MPGYGVDSTKTNDETTFVSNTGSEPKLQEKPYWPRPHIIRTSDRNTFKKCRLQWDLGSKIRQNWEPDVEAKALGFGTAIHAALETWYNPDSWHLVKNPASIETMAATAIAAFIEKWPKTEDSFDWEEDIALGKAMLNGYFDRSIATDDFTPVYVEVEFEVPVIWSFEDDVPPSFEVYPNIEPGNALYYAGLPVVYQGRIDLIVQDKYGKYWIWDHKTASSFGSTDHLDKDGQCGSYMWAIQQQLGIRIEGVVYNELVKKAPHPPKMLVPKKSTPCGSLSKAKDQDTTYDLYMTAIEENGFNPVDYADILRHLKEIGTSKYYRRTQVHRSQSELKYLEKMIALEAIDMLNNPSIYPNPDKMNCNYCAFQTPCLNVMEGSDAEWSLSQMFHKRTSSSA